MNKNRKIFLGGSIVVLVLLTFMIIPRLGKGKEAKVLSANKEITKEVTLNEDTQEKTLDAVNNTLNATTVENEQDNQVIEITEETKIKINELIGKYFGNTEKLSEEVLSVSKDQEAKEAINDITEKREGIEAYNNVSTLIKPGLKENTYVVFSTYRMKFFNINTEAPGMSVVYVVTDQNGELVIENDVTDSNLQDYINQLSEEKEIQSEIERVNEEFTKAIKEDETLKEFIEKLKRVAN